MNIDYIAISKLSPKMDNQVTTLPADDKRIIKDNRSTNKFGPFCNFQHKLRAGQQLGKTIYKKLMTELFF